MDDKALAKSGYHRAVILNCIRRYAPMSRTHLRELTGIRTASITTLVKQLLDDRVIVEGGSTGDISDRGRKRTRLGLNPTCGYAVGIEFDADHVHGIVLDIQSHEIMRQISREPFQGEPAAGIAQLADMVAQVTRHAGIAMSQVLGIGIADPGLVDSAAGVSILSSTVEHWQQVPTGRLLQERFGVPVYLEANDRAKLLAETTHGAGRGADYVMLIDFGLGVGCSVMTPAGLYRGASETAGELGHTCVTDNGHMCRCGSSGCLETVASMPAIARRARTAVAGGVESIIADLAAADGADVAAQHVFDAAARGDKLAVGIMEDTGHYFGIAIANVVNLFNPEVVILDQGFVRAGDRLVESIKRTVARQALRTATDPLRFELSCMGDFSGAIGAATLVLNDFFAIPQVPIPDFLR